MRDEIVDISSVEFIPSDILFDTAAGNLNVIFFSYSPISSVTSIWLLMWLMHGHSLMRRRVYKSSGRLRLMPK